VDILLADPPRSGMDDNMLEAILRVQPEKIIYVSCNPATLAKNIKVLKEKYLVETVMPFDLFPNTPHIESITVLQKAKV
jgi:23S rRNA (uracil1939-C5)-methyltransferase